MKNKKIAEVLKEQRKKNKLSVQEVALKLEEHSLSYAPKTIYGWENGTTQPDADTLLVLCEIYHIDQILYTFGYTERAYNYALSEYENKLIKQYRAHPEMHDAIHRLLDM